MANRVSGVVLTVVSPTTYDLSIPALGYGEQGLAIASLFDRSTFDEAHLFGNIRLKHVIGGYAELWSEEFKSALNDGLSTTAGDFFNVSFDQQPDGSWTIGFATALGGAPNQTITFNPADLTADTHDIEMVRRNLGAFLRKAGYHDLVTTASGGLFDGKTGIQAVALQTFRF